MTRPAALVAALLATAALLAPIAGAGAQAELDGPPPAGGPQPLWVPDPEEPVEETAAADPLELEVAALAAGPEAVASDAADDPARVAVAHWMAGGAREAGLPGELPVMAALVESGLRNLPYGDADSVGFFQMRLSVWNGGLYAGYLARPELQLRWFVDHAVALRAARRAAGDATYGEDPATWGEWIADVERPYAPHRGRYQPRLAEARDLLALPDPGVAPFELGLTVGGPGVPDADPAGEALATRALADDAITLDARAQGDLLAGRVDPRVTAVLLAAAARAPVSVWVFKTGHSYYTVHGTVSNHSFGRAVDIGTVDGEPVSRSNASARALALALGRLPAGARPTEIGTPWKIDAPGYFTDSGHQDHLHVGFDDPAGAGTFVEVAAEDPAAAGAPRVARRRPSSPAEPRFDAGGGGDRGRDRGEPSFEAGR